jgi:hypothetical protein
LTVFVLHFYLEAGLFFLFYFIMGGLIRFLPNKVFFRVCCGYL